MIIPNDDLRMLCIRKDWFTCGTNRQYERLFQSNRFGASVHDLALIIWICSDNVLLVEVEEALKAAEKEYDDLMEAAENEMNRITANGERSADEAYCGFFD